MSDFVKDLESYAVKHSIRFSYGNRANQNLLRSDLTPERTYLLLDPITRLKNFSEFGGAGNLAYSGQFLLVVKSTIDKTYYNQDAGERFENTTEAMDGGFVVNNSCETPFGKGKYDAYIYPILTNALTLLEEEINCTDYQINNWQILDAINVLDVNLDGVLVTFNVSKL